MPLDPTTNLEEKATPVVTPRLARASTAKQDQSGLLNPSERTHIGANISGYDAPSTYEPYLNLDSYNIFTQDVNKKRAEEQGNFRQFAYGTISGLAKGAMGAVENISYLADFDAHLKKLQGLDSSEQNWLAEAMSEGKEGMAELLPIYQEDPSKVLDFGDGAFYAKAWEGLIDSAVQFAVPGGLISKAASTGLKATRVAQLIAKLESVSPTFSKMVQGVPSGALMNYMEGKVMAVEAAKEVRKELGDLGLPQQEIDSRAEEAHDNMQMLNYALLPVSMFQLSGIAKGKGYTRNLLKDRSTLNNRFKNFGKDLTALNSDNLILQGLGESAEEITQNVMSSESQYRALKGTGKEKGSDSLMSRIKEYATNDQALLEGMMGFFGGGPQRILTEAMAGNLTSSAREEYNKKYTAQQAMQEKIMEFTKGKFNNSAEMLKKKNQLLKEGRDEEATLLDNALQARTYSEHFQMGTADFVENTLNDIINNGATPDQAEFLGEDGKARAQEMLTNFKALEKTWLKYDGLALQTELFENRAQRSGLTKSLSDINSKVTNLRSNIDSEINTMILPNLSATKKGETFTYNFQDVVDAARKDFNEERKTGKPVKRDLSDDFNKLVEGVKSKESLYDYLITKELSDDIVNEINTLDGNHSYLLSAKGEKKTIETRKNRAKKYFAEKQIKETTAPEEISKASKGDRLQNHVGETYTVVGHNTTNGKAILEDANGEKIELEEGEFKKQFQNPTTGTYTRRIDKKVVNEKQKEASKQEQTKKTPAESSDNKTSKATQKLSTKNKPDNLDNTEVLSNEGKGTPVPNIIADELLIKENDPTTLSYKSFNNLGDYTKPDTKESQDISNYLENPNNNLKGVKVKIQRTPSKEFPNAITVTLLDVNNDPITNNDTPITLFVRESTNSLRTSLEKQLLTNDIVYSKIIDQSPGRIQYEKENPTLTNLDVALNTTFNEMEFRIQLLGEFVTGEFDENGKPKSDNSILSMTNDNQEGQVIVKIKAANGRTFPLRLTVNKLQDADADLIISMYKDLLDKTKKFTITTGINESQETKELLKNHPLAKVINVNDVTYAEIFRYLLHQGNPDTKFPVSYNKFRLTYGSGENANTIGLNELESGEFKTWLTGVKIQNINWRAINNPKYKQYLVENGILQTKASYNENGIIFANALVSIDPTPFVTEEEPEFEGNTSLLELMGEPTPKKKASRKRISVKEEIIESSPITPTVVSDLVSTELATKMSREDSKFAETRDNIIARINNDTALQEAMSVVPPEVSSSILNVAITNIINNLEDC